MLSTGGSFGHVGFAGVVSILGRRHSNCFDCSIEVALVATGLQTAVVIAAAVCCRSTTTDSNLNCLIPL